MPLSEQEQRLLDEMERSLYHGDGDFIASVGRRRGGVNYSSLIGGILLALAGIAALVVGVMVQSWPVGVIGFLAMFAGVLLAVGTPHPGRGGTRADPLGANDGKPGAGSAGGKRRPGAPKSTFMNRLSDRWDRRREG